MADGRGNEAMKLCVYCAAKMEDGKSLEALGPVQMGQCAGCGRNTPVRVFTVRGRKKSPPGGAGGRSGEGRGVEAQGLLDQQADIHRGFPDAAAPGLHRAQGDT